jgi:hypothetical protein
LVAAALLSGLWSLSGLAADSGAHGTRSAFVIVAGKNSGLTNLTLGALRRAYEGDLTRVSGMRLIPFNYPPDQPMRQRFDMLLLELRPSEIGRYWIDRRIRGEGLPPRTLPSAAVLKAVVARVSGGIGYLPIDQLDNSVTALAIDGRSYSDPAYALRYKPDSEAP